MIRESVYWLARAFLGLEDALKLYQSKCPHFFANHSFQVIADRACEHTELLYELGGEGNLTKVCRECHKILLKQLVSVSYVESRYGQHLAFDEPVYLQPGDGLQFDLTALPSEDQ